MLLLRQQLALAADAWRLFVTERVTTAPCCCRVEAAAFGSQLGPHVTSAYPAVAFPQGCARFAETCLRIELAHLRLQTAS